MHIIYSLFALQLTYRTKWRNRKFESGCVTPNTCFLVRFIEHLFLSYRRNGFHCFCLPFTIQCCLPILSSKLTEDTLSLAVWLFIEFASNLDEKRRFLNVKLALRATRASIVSSLFVSWICIRHVASDFEWGSAAWHRHRHYGKVINSNVSFHKCTERLLTYNHSVNYTCNKRT